MSVTSKTCGMGGNMMGKAFIALVAMITVLLSAVSLVSAGTYTWEESAKVGDIFKAAGTSGTFVMYDVTTRKFIGFDRSRAETRYVPASTFKIPNSLIGLAAGVVTSVDEKLPYKGDPNPFIKGWVKDMGLREAITVSNVPIYQELARRIGLKRMRDWVKRLDYGNKEIGGTVDTFWLAGPLKISAVEQALFLAKLAQGTLPLPQAFQQSVQEITLLEKGPKSEIHGKTGWENAPGKGIGWWVGWVLKNEHIYTFALNLDIQKESDASKRIEIGKACLTALGML